MIVKILNIFFLLSILWPSPFADTVVLAGQAAISGGKTKVSKRAFKPEFVRDTSQTTFEIHFNLVDYNFLSTLNGGICLKRMIPRSFLGNIFKPTNTALGLSIHFLEKQQNQIWFQEVAGILVIQRLLPASSSKIGLPFVEFGPMIRAFRETSTLPSNSQFNASKIHPGIWLASGWQVYFSPRWQLNFRLSFLTTEQFATTGVGFGTQYNW